LTKIQKKTKDKYFINQNNFELCYPKVEFSHLSAGGKENNHWKFLNRQIKSKNLTNMIDML